MDNGVGELTDEELARMMGPLMPPIPVWHSYPVPVGRVVSALTAAYVDQPIESEVVVARLAPVLVHAYAIGKIKKRSGFGRVTYARRLKWAQSLIRQALAARVSHQPNATIRENHG